MTIGWRPSNCSEAQPSQCHGSLLGSARAADQRTAHTFDSKGVKIWYCVHGKGEPVVLIPV
jgi:hypothetical protein